MSARGCGAEHLHDHDDDSQWSSRRFVLGSVIPGRLWGSVSFTGAEDRVAGWAAPRASRGRSCTVATVDSTAPYRALSTPGGCRPHGGFANLGGEQTRWRESLTRVFMAPAWLRSTRTGCGSAIAADRVVQMSWYLQSMGGHDTCWGLCGPRVVVAIVLADCHPMSCVRVVAF